MTALLMLEPRVAGTEVIEPDVLFAREEDALHDSARCPISEICHDHSNVCTATG